MKKKYFSSLDNAKFDVEKLKSVDEVAYKKWTEIIAKEGQKGVDEYKAEVEQNIKDAESKKKTFAIIGSVVSLASSFIPGVGPIIGQVAAAGISMYGQQASLNAVSGVQGKVNYLNNFLNKI